MTDLVPLLGGVLVAYLWQGTVVGLLAWLALGLLRNARPQARYALACAALLACLLAPVLGLVQGLHASTQASTVPAPDIPDRSAPEPSLPVPGAALSRVPAPVLPWIVAFWVAGAGTLALRMASGLAWVRRLRTRASRPADATWQRRMDALAARFGLRRPVALRLLDDGDTPLAAGWWRPVVLVPAGLLLRMPAPLLEALLAHELAHIRRHDYLVNLLQGVVEVLLFYHPVTWWLSRRIRVEREAVADALAAGVLGEPRRLAIALSELDRYAPAQPAPALAAQGGDLMSRIEQLVRPRRRPAGAAVVLPLLGLVAASLAFYAQARLQPVVAAGSLTGALQSLSIETATLGAGGTVVPQPTVARSDRRSTAYALVRKGDDGFSMSGDMDDIDAIRGVRRDVDGDFLWFRRDARAYVVRDPELLARAETAWAPTRSLETRMKALDARMRPHADTLEALAARMERLAPPPADEDAMQAASARMGALGDQQAALADRQATLALQVSGTGDTSDAARRELAGLESRQRALSAQMARESGVLEDQAARMAANHVPMEALSREMEAASRPMEAIGRDMEALGTQMEATAAKAEVALQAIIEDALARGLAQPAPSATAQ